MTARLLLRLLAVLGLAATSLVLFGAPAQACSCMAPNADKQVAAADQVFTGTVVDSRRSGGRSTGEIVYDVEVDRSFKGEAVETVQVSTAASSATCGLEGIPDGADYLFFGVAVADRAGMVTAGLCGGSAPLTDRLVRKVEAVTGPGTTPAGAGRESGADGGGASDPAGGSSPDRNSADAAGDDSADDGVPVWPFIGGVLVIALAAGTWTARRTT